MVHKALSQKNTEYSANNRERRTFLESQIKKKSSEIGAYLKEIRDLKLYKPDYDDFQEYCESVWDWSKRHVDRLINKYQVKQNIDNADYANLILNESHARVLTGLNNHDLKMILANLKELKDSGEKVTANLIKEVRDCYENTFKKPAVVLSPYFIAQLQANDERLGVLEESLKQIEIDLNEISESVNKLINYFFKY